MTRKTISTVLIRILEGYRWAISPWIAPACRFEPTCSRYAIAAIEKHGVCRGLVESGWRLLRCQPFGKSGFDPA